MKIEPCLSGSEPMIARSKVDLPVPLRPISAVVVPQVKVADTFSNSRCWLSYPDAIFLNSIIFLLGDEVIRRLGDGLIANDYPNDDRDTEQGGDGVDG